MARKTGSKDFASKHSMNPTGDLRQRDEPAQDGQVLRPGEASTGQRKIGQSSGR